jgi:hypothetical protein
LLPPVHDVLTAGRAVCRTALSALCNRLPDENLGIGG